MALVFLFRYYQCEELHETGGGNIATLSIFLASMKSEERINVNEFLHYSYNIPTTNRNPSMVDFIQSFSDIQKKHMEVLSFEFDGPAYDEELNKFQNVLSANQLRAIRRMFEALSKTQTIIMFELDDLIRLLVGIYCCSNELDITSFKHLVLKQQEQQQPSDLKPERKPIWETEQQFLDNIFDLVDAIEEFFPGNKLEINPIDGVDYSIDCSQLTENAISIYFNKILCDISYVPRTEYVTTDYCCKSDSHTAYSGGGASTNYATEYSMPPASESNTANQSPVSQNFQCTSPVKQEPPHSMSCSSNIYTGELDRKVSVDSVYSSEITVSSSHIPNRVMTPPNIETTTTTTNNNNDNTNNSKEHSMKKRKTASSLDELTIFQHDQRVLPFTTTHHFPP